MQCGLTQFTLPSNAVKQYCDRVEKISCDYSMENSSALHIMLKHLERKERECIVMGWIK